MSVLEGPYTILNTFGVPFPVCLCMQGNGLQLRNAQWTAKQSHRGFSVSFFWPTLKSELEANVTECKKNRKRKEKKAGAKAQKDTQEAAVKVASDHLGDSTETGTSNIPVITAPITTHQRKPSSKKRKEVRSLGRNIEPTTLRPAPSSCYHSSNIQYDSDVMVWPIEYRDHEPVWFELYCEWKRRVDSSEKKAQRKRIKQPVSSTNDAITSDSDSSSSSSSLDVSCSRLVEYTVYKKVFLVSPSIAKIHTGHAPIVPSTISSRTRSKTNIT